MTHHIKKAAHVQASSHCAFSALYDLEHYATFIPWCRSAGYLSTTSTTEAVPEVRQAFIELSLAGLSYKIKTQNTSLRPASICLDLVSGPMKNLQGKWEITATGAQQCLVAIDISFQFESNFVGELASKAFLLACKQLINLFKQRAEVLQHRYDRTT